MLQVLSALDETFTTKEGQNTALQAFLVKKMFSLYFQSLVKSSSHGAVMPV